MKRNVWLVNPWVVITNAVLFQWINRADTKAEMQAKHCLSLSIERVRAMNSFFGNLFHFWFHFTDTLFQCFNSLHQVINHRHYKFPPPKQPGGKTVKPNSSAPSGSLILMSAPGAANLTLSVVV